MDIGGETRSADPNNQRLDHPKTDQSNDKEGDKLLFCVTTLVLEGERFISKKAKYKRDASREVVSDNLVHTREGKDK